MKLAIEIIAVIAAFAVLAMAGWTLVRNVIGLVRSAKVMQRHVDPKMRVLMTEGDAAQRRVLSITGNADVLQRNVFSIQGAFGRMRVIIEAFQEGFARISKLLGKLGF